MSLKKRIRLIFRLMQAYSKKWGRAIILFFFIGLAVFFILLMLFNYIAPKTILLKNNVIGVVGAYTIYTIPDYILDDLSTGLTSVNQDGIPHPGLASSWKITNSGKTYTFHLAGNQYFTDGTHITSSTIPLTFSKVRIDKPDSRTITYTLTDAYVPFLVTVSRPVFKNEFIGSGKYKVKNIILNGSFIESLTLQSTKDGSTKVYQFYPTQDALKIAFAIGEITQAKGLLALSFKNTSFARFSNAQIQKTVDYSQLITMFYNNQDKYLSDKRLREALAYALPNAFESGQRAYSPLSPVSWAYQKDDIHIQDKEHAKLLLQAGGYTDKLPIITIDTLPENLQAAQKIAESWKAIGITTRIETVTHAPSTFQAYLGNFHVPKDPDQYSLWHSDQSNNITSYKNLRVDKLLEDGRKTQDYTTRLKIYTDFQKYLLDDQPASFLYFPYSYTVIRK